MLQLMILLNAASHMSERMFAMLVLYVLPLTIGWIVMRTLRRAHQGLRRS